MSGYGSADEPSRTSSPRADGAYSCRVHGHVAPGDRHPINTDGCTCRESARAEQTCGPERPAFDSSGKSASTHDASVAPPRADHPDRSTASHRSERAYLDWSTTAASERPLALARSSVASRFDQLLHEHWQRGDNSVSNVAIADRYLGVSEKTVRQWRTDDKALPCAALLVLPPTVATELVTWIQDKRALTPHRRGMPMVEAGLDRLEKPVAAEDRDEVLRGLRTARDRLIARLDRLATEGK